jgi:hypothetical protein
MEAVPINQVLDVDADAICSHDLYLRIPVPDRPATGGTAISPSE